ncbi:hypothetical protein H5A44_17460 [Pectobacterium brasiliense]|uniref:hypothetical protein n=1 Tax=Pectobacterium brasiliense TaxID=180957 RepID=UPI00196A181E|nr:hypothetical protein [Pectobacterium brasiliense]MBN3344206.1 hypothetical protein [Pectobacterium brasiliense]
MIENIDINKLKVIPTSELSAQSLNRNKKPSAASKTIWIFKENIRAVDIYCYFNVRFGKPNGLFTLLKNHHDSDNLIHWDYTFSYGDKQLTILCKTYYIEVMKNFDISDEKKAKEKFLTDIKNDFQNYGRDISNFKKSLEPWVLFVNPFKRLKQVIESQLEKLEKIAISKIPHSLGFDPRMKPTKKTIKRWEKESKEKVDKYVEATSLGLSVSMLLPVYAESFINFIIFMLAKPEIKKDKNTYDNVLRMRINERVSFLHENCIGFAQPVDYNHVQACKDFHSIMNKRNEILHGNINPMNYLFDSIYFEYRTPLFETFRDIEYDTYKATLRGIEFEKVVDDYQKIQDFISYILLCLDAKVLEHVKILMETVHPGWHKKENRLGVLFPSHAVEGVMVYGKSINII